MALLDTASLDLIVAGDLDKRGFLDCEMMRAVDPIETDDAALLAGVIAGDETAWQAFRNRVRDPLYRLARRYHDDPLAALEARNLLLDFQADDCAVLRRFRTGKLESFIALAGDALLGARLSALFGSDPDTAWQAFERRFAGEIRARLQRIFRLKPGQTLPTGRELEDLYNDFALHLLAKRYKPLRAYSGSGEASFAWFLLNRVLANWCRDEHRREYQRWRPPEAIKRLAKLDQEVFRLLDRDRLAVGELAGRLADEPADRLDAAVTRVFRTCAPGTRGRPARESLSQARPDGETGEIELTAPGPSPETDLEDAQRVIQAANALARLDEAERLVLVLWLEHEDMSVVAKRCGRTLPAARRLKERAVRKARRLVEEGKAGGPAEDPDLVRLFQGEE
ncbi:MAG: RNA polymerase sigma factor [Alphaproteobacteria bacterium]